MSKHSTSMPPGRWVPNEVAQEIVEHEIVVAIDRALKKIAKKIKDPGPHPFFEAMCNAHLALARLTAMLPKDHRDGVRQLYKALPVLLRDQIKVMEREGLTVEQHLAVNRLLDKELADK